MRKTAEKIKTYLHVRPLAFITDEAYQLASLKHAPDMADVIWEVKRAFEKGIAPERSVHGSSGTFFLKDCESKPIAVFKPEKCMHEVAAYRLDYAHFAGVPQTVITTLEHPLFSGKLTGACQFFVKDSITAVEIDRRQYIHFSAASVRKMATLDMRIMNEDRHSSNILIVDQKQMVPIDHGYIFPRELNEMHMTWIDWKQAATQFSESELSYISLLDPEKDRRMLLDEMYLEELFANRGFIATVLLKMAAIRHLTPMEIGGLMVRKRPGHKECSRFELLIENIKKRNAPSWTLFSRYVYEEVEKILDFYEKINQQTHQTANC